MESDLSCAEDRAILILRSEESTGEVQLGSSLLNPRLRVELIGAELTEVEVADALKVDVGREAVVFVETKG